MSGIAVILGSGLSIPGKTADYREIDGLPLPGVKGHAGKVTALPGGVTVYSGRRHLYEDGDISGCDSLISYIKGTGADRLILCQAAGSLDPGLPPGSWMLASDIVSFPAPRLSGSRPAPPMISQRVRASVRGAAARAGVPLRDGVLFWTTGPGYETPAEARMAARMGAQAASMSPLPELMAAGGLGMEACCLSWITNHTANVSGGETGHAEVVRMGRRGSADIEKLIKAL
jgi:purine-nucleoside phosphorylase